MSNPATSPAPTFTAAQRTISEAIYHGASVERLTIGRQAIARVGGKAVHVEDLDAVEAGIAAAAARIQTATVVQPTARQRREQAAARRSAKAARQAAAVASLEAHRAAGGTIATWRGL